MADVRKELLTGRDDLFVVHDFLSPDECDYFITLTESVGYDGAPITTSAGPVMRKDIRNNDRVMTDDPRVAEEMWERLRPFFPARIQFWEPVGLNERFRFYRYDPGQQFDWHFDGAYERSPQERSAFTFMIYLNGGVVGGATEFNMRSAARRRTTTRSSACSRKRARRWCSRTASTTAARRSRTAAST